MVRSICIGRGNQIVIAQSKQGKRKAVLIAKLDFVSRRRVRVGHDHRFKRPRRQSARGVLQPHHLIFIERRADS